MNKHFLSLCLALTAAASPLAAQTDVTGLHLSNASFEADDIATLTAKTETADGLRGYVTAAPQSWSVNGTHAVSLLVTSACYTDNNFGLVTTIPDGNQAYYLRMGWANGSSSVSQMLSQLPAGRYRLTADVRTAYANSATSSFQLAAQGTNVSYAFNPGSAGYFTTAPWTTHTLDFTVTETSDVSIGLNVSWISGGSCLMVDNVRLYQISDDDPTPETPTETAVESPTEDKIDGTFVPEARMKDDLLQMLANFAAYLKADFQFAQAPNSKGEECGAFKSNSTMQNNEDGVRSNADLSMIAAFLCKYGKDRVTLPATVTWAELEDMAMRSLVFAYSTHKANKFKATSNNAYWGSTSTSDVQWESSLWAMSVAYSAFFQWDKLSEDQKGYIKALLKAECNYELTRNIPTGYSGDTKAEENGWEADVLAAALGLFPDDELAPRWFDRLRAFAINSYSHPDDANDHTVIDPAYDNKTVSDYYVGPNLYSDYTLQNHSYFHTSYQNVVIQELGEAALALKLFQTALHGKETWQTNALMHNNLNVQKHVLNWLALSDGELAMPNGNDWSLFLFDQIASYATNATFLRDADALMLENLAYKMIQARQQTTTDGTWLLRSDIGARRMGVQAHRVMMTWLMHETHSTADLTASTFEDFRERHSTASVLKSQNIVRAFTRDRFTTFAWQPGISSYTGYIAANSVDKNKIFVPFKANNTGNLIGWYNVSGKTTNATPVVSGTYRLDGDAWTMNGELNTNDATLNNRFAIYSTPGNAVIYLDYVTANAAATISGERGGLTAISVDEFTRTPRTLYYGDTHVQSDGATLQTFATDWVNIDNALGIVARNGKQMAFGERANNNSIMTAKLYTAYTAESRSVAAGDIVDARNITWYSNITAEQTRQMNDALVNLRSRLPEGWNGVLASDPDGTQYLFLANFLSTQPARLEGLTTEQGAPALAADTRVLSDALAATFTLQPGHSFSQPVRYYVKAAAADVTEKDGRLYLRTLQDGTVTINTTDAGSKELTLAQGDCVVAYVQNGEIVVEEGATYPFDNSPDETDGYDDLTDEYLQNPNFELDETYATQSSNVTAAGVTYAKAYTNSVAAVSSSWPNILPVKGWTAANGLAAGSNFARMYSMPYSLTQYCVSPSSVGNYASRTEPLLSDELAGQRTLTVLNSWTRGNNAITQTVRLPKGSYLVTLNMKYECPNEASNDGRAVKAGSVTNTSLTGVSIGTTTDFRYPAARNTWERLVYKFELEEPTDVTLSLGYSSDVSQGAASQTLLYIDDVRLYGIIDTSIPDAIHSPISSDTATDAPRYNLQGIRAGASERGLIIQNRKKTLVR